MNEDLTVSWEDSATPFDHALAWLEGGGHYVNSKNYAECVVHVMEKTSCKLEDAERASSTAVKALGCAPYNFTPPFYPDFKRTDIDIGDTVYGGHTVYDEYAWFSGKVLRIEPWLADGKKMYTVYILAKFQGSEFEEGIDIQSIYKVEKPEEDDDGDDFSCHYCGMPAVGFGFFNEPACKECGG